MKNIYYLCTANLRKSFDITKFSYKNRAKKMQKFLFESGLTVLEERCFRDRICARIGWSEQVWWNKLRERTQVKPLETEAMWQVINQIREEVASGTLDLRAYNNK